MDRLSDEEFQELRAEWASSEGGLVDRVMTALAAERKFWKEEIASNVRLAKELDNERKNSAAFHRALCDCAVERDRLRQVRDLPLCDGCEEQVEGVLGDD